MCLWRSALSFSRDTGSGRGELPLSKGQNVHAGVIISTLLSGLHVNSVCEVAAPFVFNLTCHHFSLANCSLSELALKTSSIVDITSNCSCLLCGNPTISSSSQWINRSTFTEHNCTLKVSCRYANIGGMGFQEKLVLQKKGQEALEKGERPPDVPHMAEAMKEVDKPNQG